MWAFSGNLRAVGAPRIDDLGSSRGTGRPETGRSAERGAVAKRNESGRSPLAVLEAGDDEAEELARDGPAGTVPCGTKVGFGGRPKAGLTQAKGVKQARATPSNNTRRSGEGLLRPASNPELYRAGAGLFALGAKRHDGLVHDWVSVTRSRSL